MAGHALTAKSQISFIKQSASQTQQQNMTKHNSRAIRGQIVERQQRSEPGQSDNEATKLEGANKERSQEKTREEG